MRPPIILTVQFDEASNAFFQTMRQKHFPEPLNLVGAHLTLFHNLPGSEEDEILRAVASLAAKTPPFEVAVTGPMKLGRGVALSFASDTLTGIRAELASRFRDWLSGQDRERFRPHVTIQNKVAPHEAAALFDHLKATMPPFDATAEGIQLWRYDRGPWRPIAAVPFQATPANGKP